MGWMKQPFDRAFWVVKLFFFGAALLAVLLTMNKLHPSPVRIEAIPAATAH